MPGALNVGLLHTALDGREGHALYAPCTLASLVDRGYEYWALGHVHRHEIAHAHPFVVYPGNLQGRHARETGPKGAVVVSYEGARVTAVEHRALDVVRWERVTVDLTERNGIGEVEDAVRASIESALRAAGERLLAVRVVLTGASAAHAALHRDPELAATIAREVAIDLTAGSVWVERVLVETRAPSTQLVELASRVGPLGELAREIRALEADPESLAAFFGEIPGLSDVLRKLRPASDESGGTGEGALEPSALLHDAEALLVSRLSELEE